MVLKTEIEITLEELEELTDNKKLTSTYEINGTTLIVDIKLSNECKQFIKQENIL